MDKLTLTVYFSFLLFVLRRKQSPLQQGPLQEQYTRQLQQQEEEKEDEEEKQSQHEAGQAVARMAKTTTLAVSPRLPKKRSPRSRILTSRIGVSVPRECAQAQQQAEEEEEEEEEELGLRDSMRVTASLRSSSRRPPQQHWLVLSADITACYPVFEVDFDLERLHLSPRSL